VDGSIAFAAAPVIACLIRLPDRLTEGGGEFGGCLLAASPSHNQSKVESVKVESVKVESVLTPDEQSDKDLIHNDLIHMLCAE
jgi:hypothetical protein